MLTVLPVAVSLSSGLWLSRVYYLEALYSLGWCNIISAEIDICHYKVNKSINVITKGVADPIAVSYFKTVLKGLLLLLTVLLITGCCFICDNRGNIEIERLEVTWMR